MAAPKVIIEGFKARERAKLSLGAPQLMDIGGVKYPKCPVKYAGGPMFVRVTDKVVAFCPAVEMKDPSKKKILDYAGRRRLTLSYKLDQEELDEIAGLEKEILYEYLMNVQKATEDRQGRKIPNKPEMVDNIYNDTKAFASRVKVPPKDSPYSPHLSSKMNYIGKSTKVSGGYRALVDGVAYNINLTMTSVTRWVPTGAKIIGAVLHVASFMDLAVKCIELVVVQALFDPTPPALLADFVCGGDEPAGTLPNDDEADEKAAMEASMSKMSSSSSSSKPVKELVTTFKELKLSPREKAKQIPKRDPEVEAEPEAETEEGDGEGEAGYAEDPSEDPSDMMEEKSDKTVASLRAAAAGLLGKMTSKPSKQRQKK